MYEVYIFIANYFLCQKPLFRPFKGELSTSQPATIRLCWLAGDVASSPEAQRTSLYLPPSLHQHFHIPSRSLTPPLSSPPPSAALVSLQLCFISSTLHLLFHPCVFALLSPSLISFRVQWQQHIEYQMKQNIMTLKIQKQIQLKCRGKGKIWYCFASVLASRQGALVRLQGATVGFRFVLI